MRKAILLIAILFCMITSYAQDTKPTRQETMDWLAGKFKDYINSAGSSVSYPTGASVNKSYRFVSYSKSKVTFIEKTNSTATGAAESTYTLDFNKITKVENYTNSNSFKIKGSAEMLCETDGPCKTDFSLVSDLNFNEMSGEWRVINFDNETELRTRFTKALENLIAYNKLEKPKEAY